MAATHNATMTFAPGHNHVENIPQQDSAERAIMPRWAQVIGEYLALTHYMRIVRAIMLKGSTLFQLQYDTLALAGLMAFAMTIAVTRFRRTLD